MSASVEKGAKKSVKNGRFLVQSYEGNDILLDAEVDEALAGQTERFAV